MGWKRLGTDISDALASPDAGGSIHLRALLDLIPVGIVAVANEGGTPRVVHANPAAAGITGCQVSPGSLRVDLPYELYPPERRAPLPDAELPSMRAALRGETVCDAELHLLRPDGEWRVVIISATPVCRDGQVTGAIIVMQDITERRQTEDALRESRDDLNRAQAVAHVGSWRADTRKGGLSWSDETYRIFGIPIGTPMTYESFLDAVPPDDRAYVDAQWQAALGGAPYDIEHQISVGDEVRWVREKAYLEFDAEGGLLGGFGVVQDITDRKRAEDALRESETRFRVMADGTPVMIWVTDAQGRMEFVNRAYREFFGTTYDEVRRAGWQPLVHPEDADRYMAEYTRALRERRPFHAEARVRHHDGEWRWVESFGAPLLTETGELRGCAGSSPDITERKRAEGRALALQGITASLSAALTPEQVEDVVLREGARVTGAAVAGLAMLVEGTDEVDVGRLEGLPGDVQVKWRRLPRHARMLGLDAMRTGHTVVVRSLAECEAAYPESAPVWRDAGLGAAVAAPLAVGGRVLGAVVFSFTGQRELSSEDVTFLDAVAGQTTQAVERARLYVEAERRAAELREESRRKDEFLAMLAHELRNPLAAISNAVQLLQKRGPEDAALQRATGVAARQSAHMARLLDDLLDVSRVTRGQITLKSEDVDLTTAIDTGVEASRPQIEARGHTLYRNVAPGPIWVHGDPVRLAQVVGNLLGNAAKYTPPGGEIHIQASREGNEAVLRVRDNGKGIARELLPHVFDLFVQGDRTPDRAEGGLGIGLTMVKGLVELHGGRVEARSDGPGKGSEFVVWLPLVEGRGAAGEAEGRESAPPIRRRVLVVDDNADAAELLAMLLEADGHEVATASSGAEALAMAPGYRPDVVLLDIGMPGMTGYEAARRMRQEPVLADSLLIAVSGYGQEEDRERSREAGFDYHLVKPVDPEALRQVILAGR